MRRIEQRLLHQRKCGRSVARFSTLASPSLPHSRTSGTVSPADRKPRGGHASPAGPQCRSLESAAAACSSSAPVHREPGSAGICRLLRAQETGRFASDSMSTRSGEVLCHCAECSLATLQSHEQACPSSHPTMCAPAVHDGVYSSSLSRPSRSFCSRSRSSLSTSSRRSFSRSSREPNCERSSSSPSAPASSSWSRLLSECRPPFWNSSLPVGRCCSLRYSSRSCDAQSAVCYPMALERRTFAVLYSRRIRSSSALAAAAAISFSNATRQVAKRSGVTAVPRNFSASACAT